MQILKGNILKSVTIQHIINNTNSYCYIYYDQELPIEGSYFVNSKYVSLEQLIGYLECEYIKDKTSCDIKDYFIVYTNKTQEEIQELIEWLDYNSHRLNARCVLITCKLDESE